MSVIDQLIEKIRIVRDDLELDQLLRELKPENITASKRVAFVNAHAVNLCYSNPDFLTDLLSCDIVLRDGSGMKILYKMMGLEPGLNMNGTDFIPRVLELYKDKSAALMGTDSPYLEKAALKVSDAGVTPAVMINGFREATVYVEALKQNPVSLAILAMGMPKQEYVARMIAAQTSSPLLILCGGAILDFMAEKVSRAPEFIRRCGMEWAYRLIQEPRRLFGRYVIGNGVFLYHALQEKFTDKTDRMNTSSKSNLKVLHVVRQYHPAIGGLESYVQNMIKNQAKLGYECEVLTLDKVFHGYDGDLPSKEIIDGVPVTRVSFKGRRRFFLPMVSPFYFRGFDIVHVHNTDMFYDYGAFCSLFSKAPFFATTHGGFFHTNDFSAIKKIYFNTVTRVSSLFYKAIFAISQNDFDTFKGLNKNTVLLHNAIEPLGDVISDGSDMMYIGRLAQHKGIEKAIRVFAALKQQHGFAGKFHIVGPEWDVKISDLQSLADSIGVTGDVIFHGAASAANMRNVAAQCGYFMSGSSFEGFGMSMLEAMSVGLIPLVHQNESFKELIGDSGIGCTTDFDDTDRAVADIAPILEKVTPVMRSEAAAYARKFSWDGLVARTDREYRKFLS
jgi:exopolysaccharide biosynthesis WecB/TagA/CpsF family protein